jgi:hypothetical protein
VAGESQAAYVLITAGFLGLTLARFGFVGGKGSPNLSWLPIIGVGV